MLDFGCRLVIHDGVLLRFNVNFSRFMSNRMLKVDENTEELANFSYVNFSNDTWF